MSLDIATHINAALAPTDAAEPAEILTPFPFGPDFETKVASLFVTDLTFTKSSASFIKPDHFTNVVERNIVAIVRGFHAKYGTIPEPQDIVEQLKGSKAIAGPAELKLHVDTLIGLLKANVRNRDYVRDRAVEFCRRQALLRLAARLPADLTDPRGTDFGKLETEFSKAFGIGSLVSVEGVDYFAGASDRKVQREEQSKGQRKTGVPTGFDKMDEKLYHGGWGRGELTIIMAPAKRGKTAFSLQSALTSSVRWGTNSLLVSLEVGRNIMEDRLDACLTGTPMADLIDRRDDVEGRVLGTAGQSGKVWLEVRPANTFTTDDVDTLLERYTNEGKKIDLVVVDYIGIMRLKPADDRFVGLGNAAKELRRIAQKYNVAMVVPAQTNRDGVGKQQAGMETIGESFAIVQDCDLLLSINATEQELAAGIRRIYFAASRNQAQMTFTVQGDLAMMQLVQNIMSVDY